MISATTIQTNLYSQMKPILIIIYFLSSLSLSAQMNLNSGTYGLNPPTDNGNVIKWNLSLNPDGTFLYHFYRNLNCVICEEENFYGKGTWKAEKNIISFYSDEQGDLDEIHTMNFNNTKARINRKSPRDISNKVIKESIIFFSSELFTIKGLELFKMD